MEDVIGRILHPLLSKYVADYDRKNQASLSLLKGKGTLRNLVLKAKEVDHLFAGTVVRCKSSFINHVEIQAAITRLRVRPICARIDHVEIDLYEAFAAPDPQKPKEPIGTSTPARTYGLSNRIADGIHVEINKVTLRLTLLNRSGMSGSTAQTGIWRCHKLRLVSVDEHDQEKDLRECWRYNKGRQEDYYVFKRMSIESVSFHLATYPDSWKHQQPQQHTEEVAIMTKTPAECFVTIQRSLRDVNTWLGLEVDFVFDQWRFRLASRDGSMGQMFDFICALRRCLNTEQQQQYQSEADKGITCPGSTGEGEEQDVHNDFEATLNFDAQDTQQLEDNAADGSDTSSLDGVDSQSERSASADETVVGTTMYESKASDDHPSETVSSEGRQGQASVSVFRRICCISANKGCIKLIDDKGQGSTRGLMFSFRRLRMENVFESMPHSIECTNHLRLGLFEFVQLMGPEGEPLVGAPAYLRPTRNPESDAQLDPTFAIMESRDATLRHRDRFTQDEELGMLHDHEQDSVFLKLQSMASLHQSPLQFAYSVQFSLARLQCIVEIAHIEHLASLIRQYTTARPASADGRKQIICSPPVSSPYIFALRQAEVRSKGLSLTLLATAEQQMASCTELAYHQICSKVNLDGHDEGGDPDDSPLSSSIRTERHIASGFIQVHGAYLTLPCAGQSAEDVPLILPTSFDIEVSLSCCQATVAPSNDPHVEHSGYAVTLSLSFLEPLTAALDPSLTLRACNTLLSWIRALQGMLGCFWPVAESASALNVRNTSKIDVQVWCPLLCLSLPASRTSCSLLCLELTDLQSTALGSPTHLSWDIQLRRAQLSALETMLVMIGTSSVSEEDSQDALHGGCSYHAEASGPSTKVLSSVDQEFVIRVPCRAVLPSLKQLQESMHILLELVLPYLRPPSAASRGGIVRAFSAVSNVGSLASQDSATPAGLEEQQQHTEGCSSSSRQGNISIRLAQLDVSIEAEGVDEVDAFGHCAFQLLNVQLTCGRRTQLSGRVQAFSNNNQCVSNNLSDVEWVISECTDKRLGEQNCRWAISAKSVHGYEVSVSAAMITSIVARLQALHQCLLKGWVVLQSALQLSSETEAQPALPKDEDRLSKLTRAQKELWARLCGSLASVRHQVEAAKHQCILSRGAWDQAARQHSEQLNGLRQQLDGMGVEVKRLQSMYQPDFAGYLRICTAHKQLLEKGINHKSLLSMSRVWGVLHQDTLLCFQKPQATQVELHLPLSKGSLIIVDTALSNARVPYPIYALVYHHAPAVGVLQEDLMLICDTHKELLEWKNFLQPYTMPMIPDSAEQRSQSEAVVRPGNPNDEQQTPVQRPKSFGKLLTPKWATKSEKGQSTSTSEIDSMDMRSAERCSTAPGLAANFGPVRAISPFSFKTSSNQMQDQSRPKSVDQTLRRSPSLQMLQLRQPGSARRRTSQQAGPQSSGASDTAIGLSDTSDAIVHKDAMTLSPRAVQPSTSKDYLAQAIAPPVVKPALDHHSQTREASTSAPANTEPVTLPTPTSLPRHPLQGLQTHFEELGCFVVGHCRLQNEQDSMYQELIRASREQAKAQQQHIACLERALQASEARAASLEEQLIKTKFARDDILLAMTEVSTDAARRIMELELRLGRKGGSQQAYCHLDSSRPDILS